MNFLRVLFLFCLLLDSSKRILSDQEELNLHMEQVTLTEGGKLVLYCLLKNALKNTILNWQLKTTDRAVPFDVVKNWVGGMNLNGTRFVKIIVKLRRDYSNTNIICHTSTGLHINFPILTVAATWLPSTNVEVKGLNVLQGESKLPTCKVSYPSSAAIKNITVKLQLGLIKTQLLETQTLNKAFSYSYKSISEGDGAVSFKVVEHNKFPTQCIATVEDSSGKKAKIYSVVKSLIVHHVEFYDRSFLDNAFGIGGEVVFYFFMWGNPIPPSRLIFIRKVDKPLANYEAHHVVNITRVFRYLMKLTCRFKPPRSGRYILIFKSEIMGFETKSKEFNVVMISLKILQAPAGVEKKEPATLTAELKIKEAPHKRFIHVYRLDYDGQVVEQLAFNVTGIIRIKANKYRFEMLILFNETSYYFISYKFLKFTIKSDPFYIHIYGSYKKTEDLIPLIVFLMVLISILFVACINDKIRSCKAEALAEDDFELTFPRPEKSVHFRTSSVKHSSYVDEDSSQ